MTILEQDLRTTAHYLVSEANGYRSRDQVVIAAGAGNLKAGAVLGKLVATGDYVPFDPRDVAGEGEDPPTAQTDGRQLATAILYEGVDATVTAARRTVTSRDAEVSEGALQWLDGLTFNQKTAALASLAAAGVIAR